MYFQILTVSEPEQSKIIEILDSPVSSSQESLPIVWVISSYNPNLKTIYVYSVVYFQKTLLLLYILSLNTHKKSGTAHYNSHCTDDQTGIKSLTGPTSLSRKW